MLVMGKACEKGLGQEQAAMLGGPEEASAVNQELLGVAPSFSLPASLTDSTLCKRH